jgi:molybdopterin-guanine dinucleotide biosynthesis protein A
MQMQCNRAVSVIPGDAPASNPESPSDYCEIPGSPLFAAPRNDVLRPVNAFLTINWAKIAE